MLKVSGFYVIIIVRFFKGVKRVPYIIIISALLGLCLLLFFALIGRGGEDFSLFLKNPIAHRGLHSEDGPPENSLAAFKRAIEKGCSIELDVHLLKDGTLAVFHDDDLFRMTGKEGRLRDLSLSELKELTLKNSNEKIPTFGEVLETVDGKVPLLIELKTGGKTAELCSSVMEALKDYKGRFCIESFDPRHLWWLRRHRPDIKRGVISENLKNGPVFPLIFMRFLISALFLNFLIAPDFVAYRFSNRKNLLFRISVKIWRIKGFVWTIKTADDYKTAINEGFIPICEKIFSGKDAVK